MKDYTITTKQKNYFILNYKKDENDITVFFASGDTISIPNNIENEKKILETMKEQVINSKPYLNKEKITLGLVTSCGVVIAGSLVAFNFMNKIDYELLNAANFTVLLVELGLCGKINRILANINDVKKHQSFIEYEKKLNEYIKKTMNIFSGTSEKTINILKNPKTIPMFKYPYNEEINKYYSDTLGEFNINNIGEVSYAEYNKMIENINREEKFNFDYNVKALRK